MDPYPESDREPLFEKPLTPSDVGKLNRLVIPKHHAEKHFPLGVDLADRGLLLNFEDEYERQWLFRYSYWSSSQSYVLTKGWSGFVKDKQLDAGDVVSFQKHRVEGDRLFIRWRRSSTPVHQPSSNGGGAIAMYYGQQHPYPPPYPPGFLHAGGGSGSGGAAAVDGGRRVRLFGVNLDSDPRLQQGKGMRRHGLESEEVVGRWDGSSSSWR